MEASSMAATASSRGAIPLYSSLRSMANSRTNLRRVSLQSGFSEKGHMQYYAVKAYCGEKREKLDKQRLKGLGALYDGSLSEKRRIKLLELVSKDLSALSTTFVDGVDAQKSLAEEVREQIFSDALQVLTAQLEQVKAERKQRKKEMKAQKKALKTQKKLMQPKTQNDDGTSSSESSTSECETANMVTQRVTQIPPNMADMAVNNTETNVLHLEFAETTNRLGLNPLDNMEEVKRLYVCMGGKCKRSGSDQLLAAFEESITKSGPSCRVEAVGCKCMGKCRSAPNVKVQNESGRELLMSVEIEKVDSIVDHHFGLQPQEEESLVSL